MNHEISYKLTLAALQSLATLPLWALYLASNCMSVVACHVLRYRKQTVTDNLRLAFPQMGEKERRKTASTFYRHLCDCIVETIKLLHITDEELRSRVEVEGSELMERSAADGRPVILYLGHYGNWEWVQAITLHYKRPSISGQIYRPLHNAMSERLMQKIRARFHTVSIPQKQAFRTLLRMARDGDQWLVGFIADQRPNSGNLHHWTTFLGQDTAYAAGGEEIGKRTGAHYFYLDVEKTRRGHYRMTFRPILPLEDCAPYPYTRRYLQMMEETIRREPAFWLWSHKRWRFARPAKEKEESQKNQQTNKLE